MTAKKKQKQKKIILKRGASVSSSSSDDDDDENAVIKDEENSERRKEKNVERMKEKIGSEMWDLTRQYKKREESVERWLNSYGFGATLMKKAVEQEQRFDGRKRRRKYVDVPRGESAESEGHEDAEEREDGFGQGD